MSDSRAYSETKIEPPHPLPYVSRKALKRVDGWLPPPAACHYCGSPVSLVSNEEIYGREYGEWPYAYLCTGCGASVGLHPSTDLPLGTLADNATREARRKHKASFLKLQKRLGWTRKQAYRWLADKMEISRMQCHWGMFSASDAEKAGAICAKELEAHD